ncbi:hypothetical protein P22_3791 [Propionispora sp. 2/2-37]|nr:hypothetical protein P22_3791 [Propionispora sp. 2/2-37]
MQAKRLPFMPYNIESFRFYGPLNLENEQCYNAVRVKTKGDTPMDITAIINTGTILFDLPAQSKVEAITQLAGCLQKNGIITNRNSFVADVLDREKKFSTAIGFGLAIPHAKSSCVLRPAIAVGKLARAINYSDAKGEEEWVNILFLIAVSEESNNEHIAILSQLSRKFMDESFRQRLTQAQNPDEMLQCLQGL